MLAASAFVLALMVVSWLVVWGRDRLQSSGSMASS